MTFGVSPEQPYPLLTPIDVRTPAERLSYTDTKSRRINSPLWYITSIAELTHTSFLSPLSIPLTLNPSLPLSPLSKKST